MLADEQAQCLEQRNHLELIIKDLEDDVEKERTGRVRYIFLLKIFNLQQKVFLKN